jgi:hypothetical protein
MITIGFVLMIACGRRTSVEISKAIHGELRAIRDYLNRTPKEKDGG